MAELGVLVIESTVRKKLHSSIVCDNAVVCLKSLFDAAVAVVASSVVIVAALSKEVVCKGEAFVLLFLTDDVHIVVYILDNCAVTLSVSELIVVVDEN